MTGASVDVDVAVAQGGFRLNASLHAAAGEVVAVMGPSGAGKSTLIGAIAGIVRLRAGRISIGDRVVASADRPRVRVPVADRGVVLLGQEPRLFPHLSARDNVSFGRRARGASRDAARREADEWLWRVGLSGRGDDRPGALSGGQQQRVAIARALATGPRPLLLAEPLTSLDPETAAGIRTVLHDQLHSTRTTAVIVTHDAVDAVALAQQLVILEDGAITQAGPVREVLSAPATSFAATIAGLNRVVGHAEGRTGGDALWRTHGAAGVVQLTSTDPDSIAALRDEVASGVAAVFRPSAVRVERAPEPSWTGALRWREEEGADVGSWLARVVRLEATLAGVRVHTSDPDVAADLPLDVVGDLGLAPGVPVRLRVDPADVRFRAVGTSARTTSPR